MKKVRKSQVRNLVRVQTRHLGKRIAAKSLVAQGSLHSRTKVCGRKSCPCATDPAQRHGPYHEWTRLEDGHPVHTILSQEQAELLEEAIENYRDIQSILREWQAVTTSILLGSRQRKGQR